MRAKTKLTADSVRRYDGRDKAGPTAIKWCIDPRGFGVRLVKDTGHKTWIVKNKGTMRTIGRVDVMPLDDARAMAKEILGELQKGVDRKAIAAARKTFGEVLDDYCRTRVDPQLDEPLRVITAGIYKRMAKSHLADWLDQPLASITRKLVLEKYESILTKVKEQEAARAKKAGRAPDPRQTGAGSANLVARVISIVWNHGVDMELEGLPDTNPVLKLKRRRRKLKKRNDHVALADLGKFYDAVQGLRRESIDCPERDAILLALYTGLRKGNVTRLRWDHVDFENRQILLTGDDMKSTRDFNVPLHDLALALLQKRNDKRAIPDSPFVFAKLGGGHIGDFAKALNNATTAAGIKHVSPQGLRRSFSTICYAAGLTMDATGFMLDHAKPKDVTAGYVQGIESKMAAWAAAVGAFLADKIGAGHGGNVTPLRRPATDADDSVASVPVVTDEPAAMTA